MKKLIKLVPFITILLVAINVIITLVDFRSAGSFSSDPNGFGVNDILCNFSHGGWWHIRDNMVHFLAIGGIVEILLSIRKKRKIYTAIVLASIIGHIIIGEIIHKYAIGASGWLASLPVVSIPVIVWFAGTSKYQYRDYSHPAWLVLTLPVLNVIVGLHWDVSSLNASDGIGHDIHLAGYIFGAAMFLVAAPFAVRAWLRTFAHARAQKRQIAVRRAEYRRKMEAQRLAA